MSVSEETRKDCHSLEDLASLEGRHPADAFQYVREGLEFSARRIHGPITPAQFVVNQYMSGERIDLDEVFDRHERGELDPIVAAAIDMEKEQATLNRNVSGQDLCWGLRDYAIQRWGRLASTVLNRWGIHRTRDFGEIVFAMVEHAFMQTEAHDTIADFESVFDFEEAFRVSPINLDKASG